MSTSSSRWNIRTILITIVLLSLFVHLSTYVLGLTFLRDFHYQYEPLHSALETAGALIAFVVAYLLLVLDLRNAGTSYNARIAAALIGMGTLDLIHAMTTAGDGFVWFHSTASIVGGAVFFTVWLPDRWFPSPSSFLPFIGGVLAVCFMVVSMALLDRIPVMSNGAKFTSTAIFLNVIGGVLLWLAALKLLLAYLVTARVDDLIFAIHCTLFGAAAVTFVGSRLWDVNWWGWHLLRLLAYGVALVFAFESSWRDQMALLERTENLEDQVNERTRQLQESLEEKETLLKEIHHRVKNNLQVISSMLSLQGSRVDDESLEYEFDRSLDRINSIALVHEFLYRSENLSDLDFEDYVRRLLDELGSLKPANFDLKTSLEFDEQDFGLDRIVNCGLILNEAVTNCLQHAFNDRDHGEILVALRDRERTYELVVEDDGSGIPEDADLTDLDSLGFELIQSIAETDLNGTVQVQRDDGTRLVVSFPKGHV